jgi:hypothetical protein
MPIPRTTGARRRAAALTSILLAALLVLPDSAAALSDPSVTERLTEVVGSFGEDAVAFTVIDPSDSSVGEIVGFVVDSEFPARVFPPNAG